MQNSVDAADRRKKRRRTLIIVIAVIAAAVAVGLYFLLRGETTDNVAYVQTVSDIVEQNGGVIFSDRYSGVVEAENTVKIRLDEDKKVEKCFVEVGQAVEVGTALFSYDVEKLKMTYQQLLIDYETLLNNCTSYSEEIKSLEKQLKKARAKAKAELNVELQTAKLNLMKEEYESKEKKEALDEAEAIISDNIVRASAAGTVRAINPPSSDSDSGGGQSSDDPYMTIVSNEDLWIKGTISEQGAYKLNTGTPVTVRSRIDRNKIWTGSVAKVNTEAPIKNENNYYYVSQDSSETASKYAFYVSLENTDGLMMGQHVYIEFGTGPSGTAGIWLSSGYLVEENGNYYVYAADSNGRIEKRPVTVGAYDEQMDAYQVESGLTAMDRIAFPDQSIHAGMKAAETGYADGTESDGYMGEEISADSFEEGEFSGDFADIPAEDGANALSGDAEPGDIEGLDTEG